VVPTWESFRARRITLRWRERKIPRGRLEQGAWCSSLGESRDDEEEVESGVFLKSGSGKSSTGGQGIGVQTRARSVRTATRGAVRRCSVRTVFLSFH